MTKRIHRNSPKRQDRKEKSDREKPYTLRDCLMELEGQEFIVTISFSEEGAWQITNMN